MTERDEQQPSLSSDRIRWRIAAAIDACISAVHQTETLIISGFWRSGTTWLQEALAEAWDAKTVFEPTADENNSPLRAHLERVGLDRAHRSMFIPLSLRQLDRGCRIYLRNSLSARSPTAFSMYCRDSIGQSLKKRILLKDVRFQGLLEELLEWSGGHVIHIWRHPQDVIRSFLQVHWSWKVQDVRLSVLHEAQSVLDAESGRKFAALLEFDRDPVERLAALWALTERRVAETAAQHPDRVHIVRYEELVQSINGEAVAWLLRDIGLQARSPTDILRRSRTTSTSAGERTRRDSLTAAQLDRVMQVVTAIYPERVTMLA